MNVADSSHDQLLVLRGMRNAWPLTQYSRLKEAFAAQQGTYVKMAKQTDTVPTFIRPTACIMQYDSSSIPQRLLPPCSLVHCLFGVSSVYMHLKFVRLGYSLIQDIAILNAIFMILSVIVTLQTTRVTNLRTTNFTEPLLRTCARQICVKDEEYWTLECLCRPPDRTKRYICGMSPRALVY